MLDISRLDPPPAGFGSCGQCAYRDVGTGGICFACASAEMEPLAENRCEVCDLELGAWGRCENPVCSFPDRGFSYVWAISMMTGRLRSAILRYKYDGVRAWASIFGRVLAGYLDENRASFQRFDLIVPSPAFTGPGASRNWDHIDAITRVAVDESEQYWPFDDGDPHAIIQTAATESFVRNNWQERRAIAEGPLRAALDVPDEELVSGQCILVFDDVFTDGLRAREVALRLLAAGAREVSQVVLARQPFTRGVLTA